MSDEFTREDLEAKTLVGRLGEGPLRLIDLPPAKQPADILKFVCRTYIGGSVYYRNGETITMHDALYVGQKVLIQGFCGWNVFTVKQIDEHSAQAESGRVIAWLRYGEDDRRCWVSTCQGNMDALANIII